MIFEPPKILTDVTAQNEPILKLLSSERAIDQFLKYDDKSTEETELISIMAIASREVCEKFLNFSLAEKQIQVYFSSDSLKRRNYRIELPYGPIKRNSSTGDIDEVLAVDTELNETAISLNTGYNLYGNQFLEIQLFKISGTFTSGTYNADYKVKYTAGYGINGYTEDLPEAIKTAMMKLVYGWYHNRDNWVPVLTSEAEEILLPFKRRSWF